MNVKFSTKLLLAIGSLACITILGNMIMFMQFKSTTERNLQAVVRNVDPMIALADSMNDMQRARINLRDALLATQYNLPEEEIEKYRERYMSLAGAVDEKLNQISKKLTRDELKAAHAEAVSGFNELKAVVGKIETATKARNFDLAIELMLTDCFVAAGNAYNGMKKLLELEYQTLGSILHEEKEKGINLVLTITGITLSLALIAVFVGLKLIQKFRAALAEAVRISSSLGEGDFTIKSNYQDEDEMGLLLKSLDQATAQLKRIIIDLASETVKLDEVSEGLESSSRMLGQSSDKVAQASESTSTAIEELSSSMAAVNNSAAQTLDSVSRSREMTQTSREQIFSLVSEVNSVESSVRNISDRVLEFIEATKRINQMTDEVKAIAEQTNLLALNAAIEAARAGEQGRGFAVVADEVRQLAESSSHSADRISETTQNLNRLASVAESAVTQGLASIDKSKHQAQEAVQSIDSTSQESENALDQVKLIANSMKEQSQATEMVNQHMSDILNLLDSFKEGLSSNLNLTSQIVSVSKGMKTNSSRFKV